METLKRLVPVALAILLLAQGALASDIANPAVKAKQSAEYSPHAAWELGYTGKGIAICIMDTGVDDSHPSLAGKWLGGVDVSKPQTPLTPRDGTFNADDPGSFIAFLEKNGSYEVTRDKQRIVVRPPAVTARR